MYFLDLIYFYIFFSINIFFNQSHDLQEKKEINKLFQVYLFSFDPRLRLYLVDIFFVSSPVKFTCLEGVLILAWSL